MNDSPNKPMTPAEGTLPPDGTVTSTTTAAGRALEGQGERFLFTPPIDIYETDEGLVLHADLPGVSIKTLELQVQDNKLTLFGRVNPPVPPDVPAVHQEYAVGDFLRSFILSEEVDHERISATMHNGVLKVVLPKAPQAKPRRIDVQVDPAGP